jgi:hypothetical protein
MAHPWQKAKRLPVVQSLQRFIIMPSGFLSLLF